MTAQHLPSQRLIGRAATGRPGVVSIATPGSAARPGASVAVGPREWSHIDKSTWPAGPWQSEPDKIQWVDPATGLDALMVRHESYGHWCGYVGVAEGHPAFGKGYDAVDAEVHGGLTFADACQEDAAEGHGVCHIPEPGRPEHIWWLGFDCAHAYDLSPAPRGLARLFGDSSTYRDRAYVEAEIADLARQLAALS